MKINLDNNMIIELVKNSSELDEVHQLTYKSFYQVNLIGKKKNERIIHHPELDTSKSTFIIIARFNNRIIGTNTLTIDGVTGLSTDSSLKTETDKIRREGLKLASSWRIAIDPEYNSSVVVLNKIIQKTIDLIYTNNVETIVFTFSPRHAKIYSKMLNLIPIAIGKDDNDDIKEAESEVIMMRGSYAALPEKWKRVSN